ncbi:hypothetical protein D9Q98_000161 [Chlorella vulgaris]|uniref:Uncharacterized protein n=1 Tax=Chlorella vulgaris TaxID=3077 RepID=A0A9D4TXP5_CHLVU|nr:hypothetical protein D9Q98_000161 [Chlorella vulgaris]
MPTQQPATKAARRSTQSGSLAVAQPPALEMPAGAASVLHGVRGAWNWYMEALDQRPLLTKAATSFVCVCVGDSLAQAIGTAPFSASRILGIATYSCTVGAATGHYWHRWLETHVSPDNPTSDSAVGTKILLDQAVLTPVMTAVFFAALKLMEGRPDAILPFMQDKYVQTLLAGYAIWVPWNYASFKFIPQDLRILAGNVVGIGWGMYVSVSCINNAGGVTSTAPSACTSLITAMEAVPGACPAIMAAVEAASLAG